MNPNSVFQLLQKSFHLALGATASVGETLQDPQKRLQFLCELGTELKERAHEWEAKGEITEQEARRFLENWFAQQQGERSSDTAPSSERTSVVSPPSQSIVRSHLQADLQELTEQVAALREELEQLRKSESK